MSNLSPEEEKVVTVLCFVGGGVGTIALGGAWSALRQALLDLHILVDEGVVLPLFGHEIGLDWARIIIGIAVGLLALGSIVLMSVAKFRRRRRLMRIADAL